MSSAVYDAMNSVTQGPPGAPGRILTAAQAKAREVNDAWAAYEAEKARYDRDRKPLIDLGWKPPKAPKTPRFEGDINDEDALLAWYRTVRGAEAWSEESDRLHPKNFESQTDMLGHYGQAVREDLENYRRVIEENKRVATAFMQDLDQWYANSQRKLDEAFGGSLQTRLGEIDSSMARARADVQNVRDVAERTYGDVMKRLDDINRFGTESMNWLEGKAADTLNRLRDDVANQLDTVRGAIRDNIKAQANQALTELQAAGYDLDSPQALSAARKTWMKGMEQIGNLTGTLYSDYNRLRAETSSKFAELGTNLRQSIATAKGQGAIALAEAGKSLTGAYVETSKLLEDIEQWGQQEKTKTIYNYTILQNAADQLYLMGQTAGTEMFLNANQWVGEAPFVHTMISLKQAFEAKNEQTLFNWLNFGLNFFELFGTIMGWGGLGEPDTPKDKSWIGGAAGGVGAAVGGIFSDRNLKQGFQPVDAGQILEKVKQLPIERWQYKDEPGTPDHVGPMAQDFKELFGLGSSDRTIAMVDAIGVALAALKALAAQVDELKARLEPAG